MNEDETARSKPPPYWTAPGQPSNPTPIHMPREETALTRFLGGSPGGVFLRLLFVSLIVGAFLMWLDIRPMDVFRAINDLVDRIWSLGFDAIRVVADYILAGAVIVVPVWFVLRLMNMRSGR
ncbi:MAG TPA: DUF6460 domain-containing protein [Methylocella sp.]|nr:DUF6460 domain-containing protein [Methylocella sp.]